MNPIQIATAALMAVTIVFYFFEPCALKHGHKRPVVYCRLFGTRPCKVLWSGKFSTQEPCVLMDLPLALHLLNSEASG